MPLMLADAGSVSLAPLSPPLVQRASPIHKLDCCRPAKLINEKAPLNADNKYPLSSPAVNGYQLNGSAIFAVVMKMLRLEDLSFLFFLFFFQPLGRLQSHAFQ